MNDGDRAMCCSLFLGGCGWPSEEISAIEGRDEIVGEGEGGKGMSSSETAFPFDL